MEPADGEGPDHALQYTGCRGALRQDRRVDAGERFFRKCAHQGRGPHGQVFVRGVEGGTAERKAMIDREHAVPIQKQAKVLEISRASVYYRPRPVPESDLRLMRRIGELHLNYPFAGSRMLRDLLRQQGLEVGRRHVRTLMRKIAIEAIYRRPNTSKPAPGHRIYPYLLRDVAITRSDQV